MVDFLVGVIVGCIGVYVYDTYFMKRTKYRPITKTTAKRPLGKNE